LNLVGHSIFEGFTEEEKKCKMGRPRAVHRSRIALGAGDVLLEKTILPFIVKRNGEISSVNAFRGCAEAEVSF
jgi:hypothetical protein